MKPTCFPSCFPTPQAQLLCSSWGCAGQDMAVGQFPVFNTGGFSTGACLLRAFGKVSALPHLHKHATPPMTCNEHRAPHGAALAGCVDIKQGLKHHRPHSPCPSTRAVDTSRTRGSPDPLNRSVLKLVALSWRGKISRPGFARASLHAKLTVKILQHVLNWLQSFISC